MYSKLKRARHDTAKKDRECVDGRLYFSDSSSMLVRDGSFGIIHNHRLCLKILPNSSLELSRERFVKTESLSMLNNSIKALSNEIARRREDIEFNLRLEREQSNPVQSCEMCTRSVELLSGSVDAEDAIYMRAVNEWHCTCIEELNNRFSISIDVPKRVVDRCVIYPAVQTIVSFLNSDSIVLWLPSTFETEVKGETEVLDHVKQDWLVGDGYKFGFGVRQDETEASRRYKIAALNDHVLGKIIYTLFYEECGDHDFHESFVNLRHLASQGGSKEQFWLGLMLERGVRGCVDVCQAAYWYTQSAEQGNFMSQCNLAKLYEKGSGVELDEIRALVLYRMSAEEGYAHAQCRLGKMYGNTSAEYFNAVESVKWYTLAAEQGHAQAQNNLGACWQTGQGVSVDKVVAVHWYRLSAAQGNKTAQYNLGRCLHKGDGVKTNIDEALKLYEMSAINGFSKAQNNLGVCYRDGIGVPADALEALKLFKLAAENKDAHAQYNIGLCLERGVGCPQNKILAKQMFKLSADQGHLPAARKM